MSLYITCVTILDRIVELISPPISTIAKGAISGLGFNAVVINPQIAVIDVRQQVKTVSRPLYE